MLDFDTILAQVLSVVGLALVIFVKDWISNSRKKKNDEAEHADIKKDLQQLKLDVKNVMVTMSNIDNDVKEIKIITKYQKFRQILVSTIQKKIYSAIKLSRIENDELKNIFFGSVNGMKEVITDILNSDFQDVNSSQTIDSLIAKAKIVRSLIERGKLDLPIEIEDLYFSGLSGHAKKMELANRKTEAANLFLDEVKMTVVLPAFRVFAEKTEEIGETLENGKRGIAFETALLDLVRSVVNGTVSKYLEYKNNSK